MASPGEKMRMLRGNRTQAEVAERLGISPSTYASYEQGTRRPKDSMKIKIAEYYQRSVKFIFFSE